MEPYKKTPSRYAMSQDIMVKTFKEKLDFQITFHIIMKSRYLCWRYRISHLWMVGNLWLWQNSKIKELETSALRIEFRANIFSLKLVKKNHRYPHLLYPKGKMKCSWRHYGRSLSKSFYPYTLKTTRPNTCTFDILICFISTGSGQSLF